MTTEDEDFNKGLRGLNAYNNGDFVTALKEWKPLAEEGDAFVPRYFDLLRAGGSDSPAQLVSAVGFDIKDPNFWQSGCDLIRRRVDLATELAGGIES